MHTPTVSIAIMSYNAEHFIKETLDSCFAQTYTDFEICISDDKSTDKTVEIIKQYQLLYPGVIKLYIQPENMGKYSISINDNKRREMCTGKYIAYIDADDIMEPNRLAMQVEFLDNNLDYIAVYSDVYVFNSTDINHEIIKHNWKKQNWNPTPRNLILYGSILANGTMMFRQNQYKTSPALKNNQDHYLLILFALHGKIGYIPEKLTKYRLHNNNITKSFTLEDNYIMLALLENQFSSLRKYINIKRAHFYLIDFKNNVNITTFKNLLSIGLVNVFKSLYFIFTKNQ